MNKTSVLMFGLIVCNSLLVEGGDTCECFFSKRLCNIQVDPCINLHLSEQRACVILSFLTKSNIGSCMTVKLLGMCVCMALQVL